MMSFFLYSSDKKCKVFLEVFIPFVIQFVLFLCVFIFTLVFGKAAKKLLVTFLKKIPKASFALSAVFMGVQSLVSKNDLKVSVFFLL